MAAQLSAEQVLTYLRQRRAESSDGSRVEERRRGYRNAAAVLVSIRSLAELKPVGIARIEGEAERLLTQEMIALPGRKFKGMSMLAAEPRRAGLRDLGSRSAMQAALLLNPQERSGSLQAQLERYLDETAKPVQDQTLAELEDTLQVVLWLQDALDDLPDPEDVDRRLQFLRILSPFETLAGDDVFRGRKREMDLLRRYVDVIEPDGLLERLKQKTLRWIKPRMQPALSVHGPGGVGKSALISRFMLEHARLPLEARLPFVYLDFDRPGLDISNPLTLCSEMLRQLHLQFPEQSGFKSHHEFLMRVMAEEQSKEANSSPKDPQLDRARGALADIVGGVEGALGPRPFIVALDTFEEVQYRGEARAFPFWEMLSRIQEARPFLRVVISGRAPVRSLMLAGKPPQELEIGALDQDAAIAFLKTKGVADETFAARLVRQFGGVPLSLKLAADLVKRLNSEEDALGGVGSRSGFWSSVSDEVIQGQLYERILGHIHDPRVERLAHPGLVLRRITAEVIFAVLNEPCGLGIGTLNEAQDLFAELRKETSLVTFDDDDGALVHRPDLRRVMLKMLVQKEPAQVEQIRRAAVTWYSSQSGRRARAEELYHRLQLGEAIDRKDVRDPEIKASLQASMQELPVTAQLLLASYGFSVADEVLKYATQEQTELHEAARIEELMSYGEASIRTLVGTIQSLMPGIDHASELFRSAARVAMQSRDRAAALQWIEQGMDYAAAANNTRQTMTLLSEKAWALRDSNDQHELSETLALLNEYGIRHRDRAVLFQHRAQLFETMMMRESSPELSARLIRQIGRLLTELEPRELWGLVPTLEHILVPLLAAQPGLPSALRSIVLDDTSPFRHAEFAAGPARGALEILVENAYGRWSGESEGARDFVIPFQRLCGVWPYRVLHVQPPYGRGTSELSEAIA